MGIYKLELVGPIIYIAVIAALISYSMYNTPWLITKLETFLPTSKTKDFYYYMTVFGVYGAIPIALAIVVRMLIVLVHQWAQYFAKHDLEDFTEDYLLNLDLGGTTAQKNLGGTTANKNLGFDGFKPKSALGVEKAPKNLGFDGFKPKTLGGKPITQKPLDGFSVKNTII